MKRLISALGLLLFSTALCAATESTPKNGNARLVGKWTWTRAVNGCTEVYEYRPDGTLFVTSGNEKSDNTYMLSAEPTSKGFFRVTSTIVKDYGGKDCADSDSDDTGATDVRYILFDQSGKQHIVCEDESLDRCMGPLRKLGD